MYIYIYLCIYIYIYVEYIYIYDICVCFDTLKEQNETALTAFETRRQDPMPVLRATFLEQHVNGTGPKTGYSPMKRNQERCRKKTGDPFGCLDVSLEVRIHDQWLGSMGVLTPV